MAHEGTLVALAEISIEIAQIAAEELLQQDCQAQAIQTDITREAEVQTAVSRTLEHFGRVDIIVWIGLHESDTVLPVNNFIRGKLPLMDRLRIHQLISTMLSRRLLKGASRLRVHESKLNH